jgi:2-polyprenyl-3-methyl-5-hydroxy-6-metoxy-1,4-benzoquinol methylase
LLTLDVGCGGYPRGDVNIDIRLKKGVPNFVLSDAHHLPFRTETFGFVYCSHVLEHCLNPCKVLEEIERVVNGKVVIKVPNMGVWDARDSSHIYSWTKYSFQSFLERHFRKVSIGAGTHLFSRPVLRKYTLVKRVLIVIDYLVSYVLLGFIKNELVAVGYKK